MLTKKTKERQKFIFEMYHNQVFRTAYYICKDRHMAQDAMQETFIKAFKQNKTLQGIEKVGAWLNTICTRTTIDMTRLKQWNEVPIESSVLNRIEDSVTSVEEAVDQRLLKDQVSFHLRRLKPEFKEILVLKYIHGLRDDEIAEKLDIKVGTIKSRIHRAKKELEKRWNTVENEGDYSEIK